LTGYENRKPRLAKAQILKYLFEMDALAVPVSRDAIIRGPAGHGSKAIYRHLADLEYEKIIKTTHPKGGKLLCKLNGNLHSLVNVLDYWLIGSMEIKDAAERAFAECFTSPFGDFQYAIFRELKLRRDESFLSLNAKIYELVAKGVRPSFDKDELETINRVAMELRGPMDAFHKLMYMAHVLELYEIPDSAFNSRPVRFCTVSYPSAHFFAYTAQKVNAIDGVFFRGYDVLRRIAEISNHKVNKENRTHFLGKVTEREYQASNITVATELVHALTVDQFERFQISGILKGPLEAWYHERQ